MTKKDFEKIYLQYYPTLMVYGKAIAGDEALVEDVIQELFLKLWEKRNQLKHIETLENYLMISLRNNLRRKLQQQNKMPTEIPTPESASEVLLQNEKRIEQLLTTLPPRQREVIFLRYYQNKSYQEIAQVLGISYQVARNFAYRALKSIRKNWQKLPSILL